MSGHVKCICKSRKNWRVTRRNYNNSYFEYPKGQKHYSEYSSVICISKDCMGNFRTKAKYVDDLKDFDKFEKPE